MSVEKAEAELHLAHLVEAYEGAQAAYDAERTPETTAAVKAAGQELADARTAFKIEYRDPEAGTVQPDSVAAVADAGTE